MMTGKTRKEVREQLRSLGKIQQAEEMRHRAELLKEAARSMDDSSGEATVHMAKTMERSGLAILRDAGKAAKMLSTLEPLEHQIITLRYIDGKSWSDVCRALHYSRDHVARIERQAVDKIRGL